MSSQKEVSSGRDKSNDREERLNARGIKKECEESNVKIIKMEAPIKELEETV